LTFLSAFTFRQKTLTVETRLAEVRAAQAHLDLQDEGDQQ